MIESSVLARLNHGARVFALPGCEAAIEQELGHANYAIERRADLVAHVGQKIAFCPAGRLDMLDLLLDLGIGKREQVRLRLQQFIHT